MSSNGRGMGWNASSRVALVLLEVPREAGATFRLGDGMDGRCIADVVRRSGSQKPTMVKEIVKDGQNCSALRFYPLIASLWEG